MAATLELKYFNSFWLKKLDTIVDIKNTTSTLSANVSDSNTLVLSSANPMIAIGQAVTWQGYALITAPTVVYINGATITLNMEVNIQQYVGSPPVLNVLTFGPITNFDHVQNVYAEGPTDWFVEESRIQGGYNNTDVDLGVKAYLVETTPKQQHLMSSLIYSGILNSRTGVNNTNQFSVGEDISRTIEIK
jgi:hypothetical protein